MADKVKSEQLFELSKSLKQWCTNEYVARLAVQAEINRLPDNEIYRPFKEEWARDMKRLNQFAEKVEKGYAKSIKDKADELKIYEEPTRV